MQRKKVSQRDSSDCLPKKRKHTVELCYFKGHFWGCGWTAVCYRL